MSTSLKSGRSKAPVFVVGCPRSGTTLLYDMLLSAGGFALYLAESNVFNLLVPRFGDPGVKANRQRLLDVWLKTKLFRAAHIDGDPLVAKLNAECHSPADFLRIFMEEICRAQGVERWADNSPEEMLYIPTIKQLFPDALFVHIIRDGRDCAASLNKQGWIRPLPGDRRLISSGLYWEWIVRKGRSFGKQLGADYMELRFEELLAHPDETLAKVGEFLEHDLNYGRIQQAGVGSVSKPNTSFSQEPKDGFNPVGRWKKNFSDSELAEFEETVGGYLDELGYPPASGVKPDAMRRARKRGMYRNYFDAKIWMKNTWTYRMFYGMLGAEENIRRINYIVMADDVSRPVPPMAAASRSR